MSEQRIAMIRAAILFAGMVLITATCIRAQGAREPGSHAGPAAAMNPNRGPMIDLVRLGHSIGLAPPWDEEPSRVVVLVQALLDSAGHADTVFGAPQGSEFIPATAQALRATTLEPARQDGVPVACVVTLRIEFQRRIRQGSPIWVAVPVTLGWRPNVAGRATANGANRFKPFPGALSVAVQYDSEQLTRSLRYPEAARGKHLEGVVNVIANVRADGVVDDVAVASSDSELLNDAAVEAVLLTRFTAALCNGTPVTAPVTIPVTFKLQ